jgi:hypothetical protein
VGAPSMTGRVTGWALPSLLAAAWLAVVVLRRPVQGWFFAVAAVLPLLCIAMGIDVGRAAAKSAGCARHPVMCLTDSEIAWWMNGVIGLLTWIVLLGLTAVVDVVRDVVRVARGSLTETEKSTDPPTGRERRAAC